MVGFRHPIKRASEAIVVATRAGKRRIEMIIQVSGTVGAEDTPFSRTFVSTRNAKALVRYLLLREPSLSELSVRQMSIRDGEIVPEYQLFWFLNNQTDVFEDERLAVLAWTKEVKKSGIATS